ncbi:MAG: hypothetical protein IJS78_00035 [Clostridia bacterium]|nr:hypothetical protein [Clostridia bacterium]
MLKKLKSDLVCVSAPKAAFIVLPAVAAVLGVLTWVTTGGVPFFWRVMRKPPFTPPLFVLFALSVAAYLFFGFFAAICLGRRRDQPAPLINSAAAFFFALFWCPLFFSAKCVVAASALLLSAAVLIPAAVSCGKFYASVFLAAVPLWALEAYFLYLTVGFAVLN